MSPAISRPELKQLSELLDLLRSKGVTDYSDAEITLKLALAESAPPSRPETDPEVCLCGHGMHTHNNGLCVMGCDVEKCLPPEAKVE